MAIVNVYNHTRLRFADGSNLAANTYRCNLYSAFTFDATATTLTAAQVGATQLPTANGYTQNSQNLTGVTIAEFGTSGANFDANDIIWTASGGSIAASHALIYNQSAANQPPVLHIDFEGTVTATDGQPFSIQINADGLLTFTAP